MGEGSPNALTNDERELLARRREIADAAIAIADADGFDAVSMRNVANRLGVGTMTLYHWVENKDDLISAMSNALAEQMLVDEPLPDDWRAAITQIAFAARDVFLAHPWMYSRRRPQSTLGANILLHVDQSLRAVAALDTDWQTRAAILQAVDNYAVGYALSSRRRHGLPSDATRADEQAPRPKPSARAAEADDIQLRDVFANGSAPALAAYFGSPEEALERIRQGPPEVPNSFELGLTWLLDGVAAMVERSR